MTCYRLATFIKGNLQQYLIKLRPGTVLGRFEAKDGAQVTLRTPQWSDLDDLLEFINSLVEEEVMISVDTKATREGEVDWLARQLSSLEKDDTMTVVAEVNGKVVGNSSLTPRYGRMSHLGVLGISIMDGYRDKGIGGEMMAELERHAPRLGVKTILLEVFADNSRAVHVYEKQGYKVTGSIPEGVYYKGEYMDSLYMVKKLG